MGNKFWGKYAGSFSSDYFFLWNMARHVRTGKQRKILHGVSGLKGKCTYVPLERLVGMVGPGFFQVWRGGGGTSLDFLRE